MAWLAVDQNGNEYVYEIKPTRVKETLIIRGHWYENGYSSVRLPDGSIEKLIGRKLTWDDEPVEI